MVTESQRRDLTTPRGSVLLSFVREMWGKGTLEDEHLGTLGPEISKGLGHEKE